jgi:hypothetical protein
VSVAATCALLGWELREAGEPSYADEPGAVVVWPSSSQPREGRLDVVVLGEAGDRREYSVSRPAFDVASLLELRGVQALDVGPCPECEDRIAVCLAAFKFWADIIDENETITPWAMERWLGELRDLIYEHTGEWRHVGVTQDREDPTRCQVSGLDDLMAPCSCDVDGKPTGRKRVHAFEAVLMGEPRAVSRDFEAGDQIAAKALAQAAYPDHEVSSRSTSAGWSAWALNVPGHEGARAALRQLAEEWREHLPVLADWMADHGEIVGVASVDLLAWSIREGKQGREPSMGRWLGERGASLSSACPAVPRAIAQCPAVPAWVLAWLAGPCKAGCRAGRVPYGERRYYDCAACSASGLALGPHLGAIRAHLAEAWQRATVECGSCFQTGVGMPEVHGPFAGDGDAVDFEILERPCQRCAGLGRVRVCPACKGVGGSEEAGDCERCKGLGRVESG